MINTPLGHDRHGLESDMRMHRKARDSVAVVHTPSILTRKISPKLASCQRRIGAEIRITGRVTIVVIRTHQERIPSLPWKAQRSNRQHDRCIHVCTLTQFGRLRRWIAPSRHSKVVYILKTRTERHVSMTWALRISEHFAENLFCFTDPSP